MIRLLTAFAAVCLCGSAQFEGLATPYDGSAVYFASTLRLKGANQPRHGKLFVAGRSGARPFRSRDKAVLPPTVRLLRSRDKVELPPAALPCTLGEPYAFTGAEISADGRTIAAAMQRTVAGGCSYPPNSFGTDLISPAGEFDVPGVARLSPSGRYAVVFNASALRPCSAVEVFFLDMQSGSRTPASLPATTFPDCLAFLFPNSGHVIADDGTAILSYGQKGFLVRPGEEPQTFPIAQGVPLLINADGAKVLYRADGLHLFNLRTKEDHLVIPAGDEFANLSMSDDGQRLLFLRAGQAYVVQTDGTGLRALTSDPAEIQTAVLSGNGKVAYALTGGARLIKINADTGDQTEIVGRTPYIKGFQGPGDAGLAITAMGFGLSEVSLRATPPLHPWLGDLTMWVEERKAPVLEVTPTSVRFIVSWDILPGDLGQVRVLAETAGEHSPFDFPEAYLQVIAYPRAGLIAHQNWDGSADFYSPPHSGEIIHIWAVGLGAVSPEPPEGTVAPSSEPLARLAQPLVCSNSEVLYAGLAPGFVERIYQVDLRIGNVTGYTQFVCSIGGKDPFIFVSLNILP